MYGHAEDFKAFYETRTGAIIRATLCARIREFWPDLSTLSLMGAGYALPYLEMFEDEAERIFAMVPARTGAHPYKGRVCLYAESAIPLETHSVDRILLVHGLEYGGELAPVLSELWRVLKAGGRILVIVPNRNGFWSRTEWSPFGTGTPFSALQICTYLENNGFHHERTCGALFLPPVRSPSVQACASFFEKTGSVFCPTFCNALGGVYLTEASKQLYAGTPLRVTPTRACWTPDSAPAVARS